ncbi:MAG: hypothetical protein WCS83_01795 [Endomicrobiia bacterium]|nr:hypothetical protein [Endomicrobiaceae bacterium]MDD3053116.1 hypothetical protein [Endomicrobiaceae bacterium]MDD3922191.1 hypothetical protein [Endomicrobiaceae bacterium]
MLKLFFYCFFIVFLFSSCTPSYPKETLLTDIKKLVKKESGQDCELSKINDTIYLDMQTEGLTSTNTKVVNEAIVNLQNAVFAITRVALSSDADIKIMVITAHDPNYNIALRMFQNIDDVKSYFYQRISRGDYEQRQLLEFEGPETAEISVMDRHHITEEEYVARLVISQINMIGRKNQVLGPLISTLGLRYGYIKYGNIYILSKKSNNVGTEDLLKKIIFDEVVKNLQKYKLFAIKSVIILDSKGSIVFEVPIDINKR